MKYLGGKNKIARYIADFIKDIIDPTMVDGYLEPFCGSLAITVRMIDYKKVLASDIHSDLIKLWKEVKKNTFVPPKTLSESEWKNIKTYPSPSAMKAFAGFGCSFGGKFFGGYAQKYTNGKKENYLKAATNSINKIRPLIENVKFYNKDYKKWRPKNMLIYCDPPYVSGKFPVKYRTGVKKYSDFDNKKFWDAMRKWSKKNYVFISEQNAPDDFISVWSKKKYRSISNSKKTRYKSTTTKKYREEHLFVHKDSPILDIINQNNV